MPAPDLSVGIALEHESWKPPRPAPGAAADPILHSASGRTEEIITDVDIWIDRYTGRSRASFERALGRMERYGDYVDSLIAERGLPPSLRYLPIVESGYSPAAVSHASAAGMWQFMAPVARSMGMRVDAIVDQRRDPFEATPRALAYLEELHGRFGSWFLALAAYNGGPSRVSGLLRRHRPLAFGGDSLYLVIRPHLPLETREFIPKFLAAATLAERPARYGLAVASPEDPLRFDVVTVPDATTLDVVASAAGVTENEIRELNPQLLRGVTPRGRVTELRVPEGSASRFNDAYVLIPPNERVTVTEHVVASGETLSEIAERYGIRTAALQDANPRVRPRTLQIGTRLVVPLVPRGGR